MLNRPTAVLQLRGDPNSLAPERLLVLEVSGPIKNFAIAVSKVAGLEFSGEEELDQDEFDDSPEYYLLVPQISALREITSLWDRWVETGAVPRNFTPWRDVFLSLRSIRPWGPSDRVSEMNRSYFKSMVEGSPDTELIRIEIELVYRASLEKALLAEGSASSHIRAAGGIIIHSSRRPEFAYHAILADVPAAEVRRISDLNQSSLAGDDTIASIVPQSVGAPVEAADRSVLSSADRPRPELSEPIAAIFDAMPEQAHPLLADHIAVDDPSDMETKAVGPRVHGTAMASLVVHGDLNESASPIKRSVYFRPVMYAPFMGDERFDDDRLVVDVIFEAVKRMREGSGANVIVVNLSLGDHTRPFSGKVSTWARALDYLAFNYGILFLISAGNVGDSIQLSDADAPAFLSLVPSIRNESVFRGLDQIKADRRILAPADSINALTIGSWHRDASTETFGGTSPFLPFDSVEMPNLSSRLGPGNRRGTKPDALFSGGAQRVRVDATARPAILHTHPHPSRFWGLKVAAPSGEDLDNVHFTLGTSAATAIATHSAHRIFDAVEAAYPQLVAAMPLSERAALLKALLVHSASWRGTNDFIRSVVDPSSTMHHEHWRREVCRHLGYGFVDPEDAVACASDRATFWATGAIGKEGSITFEVPAPGALATSAAEREVRATLAWLTPIHPGHLAYRGVKLRIPSLQDDALELAGVSTMMGQPTNSQSENGTVTHRIWRDARIGSAGSSSVIPIQVQREADQGAAIDEAVPFGLAVTIQMPSSVEIYSQVLTRINVQPRTRVRV